MPRTTQWDFDDGVDLWLGRTVRLLVMGSDEVRFSKLQLLYGAVAVVLMAERDAQAASAVLMGIDRLDRARRRART